MNLGDEYQKILTFICLLIISDERPPNLSLPMNFGNATHCWVGNQALTPNLTQNFKIFLTIA